MRNDTCALARPRRGLRPSVVSWRIAVKVLKSMKIGKKIGVIVFAMLVPIILLASLYATSSWSEVKRVSNQVDGIPFVIEARNLMQAFGDHRAFTTKVKEGDAASAAQANAAAE